MKLAKLAMIVALVTASPLLAAKAAPVKKPPEPKRPEPKKPAPKAPAAAPGGGDSITLGDLAGGIASANQYPGKELPVDEAWKRLEEEAKGPKQKGIPFFVNPSDPAATKREVMNALARDKAPAEAYSRLVQQVAASVATDLPLSSEIKAAQNKQVLLLSDITERGRDVQQLKLAMNELRVQLVNSKNLSDSFVFVVQSEQAGQQALARARASEPWESADPTTGVAAPKMVRYAPGTIYSFSGTIDMDQDVNRHAVTFQMFPTVVKPQNGQAVFMKKQAIEYRYHPYQQKWITADEDAGLAKTYAEKTHK